MWKCDNVGIDSDLSDLVFSKVDGIYNQSCEGLISLSAQKRYALLTGTNSILLYNIEKG